MKMTLKRRTTMLFDCDPKLIRTLAKEQKVGLRDVTIKPKILGPNELTYVGAKSMRGVEFVKKLEEKIPKVVLDYVDEEEETDEEETDEETDEEAGDEDEEEAGDEEDLDEEEDDLDEEEEEEDE